MTIGAIADTHVDGWRRRTDGDPLSATIRTHFAGVDVILHAGDIGDPAFIEWLETIAPVHAVHGNMDRMDARRRFPPCVLLELGGRSIGLTHGNGPPHGIRDRIRTFFEPPVDIIVFGHTHEPLVLWERGILFVNPGSPTDTRFAEMNALARITLDDTPHARIITLPRTV